MLNFIKNIFSKSKNNTNPNLEYSTIISIALADKKSKAKLLKNLNFIYDDEWLSPGAPKDFGYNYKSFKRNVNGRTEFIRVHFQKGMISIAQEFDSLDSFSKNQKYIENKFLEFLKAGKFRPYTSPGKFISQEIQEYSKFNESLIAIMLSDSSGQSVNGEYHTAITIGCLLDNQNKKK